MTKPDDPVCQEDGGRTESVCHCQEDGGRTEPVCQEDGGRD